MAEDNKVIGGGTNEETQAIGVSDVDNVVPAVARPTANELASTSAPALTGPMEPLPEDINEHVAAVRCTFPHFRGYS